MTGDFTNIGVDKSSDSQTRELVGDCKRLDLDLKPELGLFFLVQLVAVAMFHVNQPVVERPIDLEHASYPVG